MPLPFLPLHSVPPDSLAGGEGVAAPPQELHPRCRPSARRSCHPMKYPGPAPDIRNRHFSMVWLHVSSNCNLVLDFNSALIHWRVNFGGVEWTVEWAYMLSRMADLCKRRRCIWKRIWRALFNQLHSRVPVCDRHLPTSLHRGQEPSSASGPSVMPARLRGTHCRATSAKQSTLLLLESC